LFKSSADFNDELRRAFPECGEQAVEFYKLIDQVRVASTEKKQGRGGILKRVFGKSDSSVDSGLESARSITTLSACEKTSKRFHRFIDAQLKAFLHTSIDRCSLASACRALGVPRQNLYRFDDGAAQLATQLAESIKSTGGVVRLNSPVLRLAHNEAGEAIGVDLLSGETIIANKAILSNLTRWDTYGRLVGLQRTPSEIKNALQKLQSRGAYVIYSIVDEVALDRLPAHNFLVSAPDVDDDDFAGEFTMSVGGSASAGVFPMTVKTSTEVNPWFAYQTSEEDYEQRDQAALEQFWTRLHKALPELGDGIEVIETANPRTYYDETRRKLGMVMGTEPAVETSSVGGDFRTSVPNLFMVGDTTGVQPNLESLSQSALLVANHLTK
jgi:phytoene dehydrogenase-like protein